MLKKLKGLNGKLDKACADYVKARDRYKCRRCGRQHAKGDRGYHWAHIHGRRKFSVRWHPSNSFGMCYGCHSFLDSNPTEKMSWYIRENGQEMWDHLMLMANKTRKWTDQDKLDEIETYQDLLEEILPFRD